MYQENISEEEISSLQKNRVDHLLDRASGNFLFFSGRQILYSIGTTIRRATGKFFSSRPRGVSGTLFDIISYSIGSRLRRRKNGKSEDKREKR
jgi:hypothetical protein